MRTPNPSSYSLTRFPTSTSSLHLPRPKHPRHNPPHSPYPFTWHCHKCKHTYRFSAALNRCLSCSHRFCRKCGAVYDYSGWDAWQEYYTAAEPLSPTSVGDPERLAFSDSSSEEEGWDDAEEDGYEDEEGEVGEVVAKAEVVRWGKAEEVQLGAAGGVLLRGGYGHLAAWISEGEIRGYEVGEGNVVLGGKIEEEGEEAEEWDWRRVVEDAWGMEPVKEERKGKGGMQEGQATV